MGREVRVATSDDIDKLLDMTETRFWSEPNEGGVLFNGKMPSIATMRGTKLVRVADVVEMLRAEHEIGATCLDAARFLEGMA